MRIIKELVRLAMVISVLIIGTCLVTMLIGILAVGVLKNETGWPDLIVLMTLISIFVGLNAWSRGPVDENAPDNSHRGN